MRAMTSDAPGRIVLRRGSERRAVAGHLWVYGGEIGRTEGDCPPGGEVDVTDHRGRFLARGYYNPASSIAVRIMTRRRDEHCDAKLLRRRIARAIAHRRRFYDAGESCRLVYSEGDWLPGLIVDRYGACLVVQIGTLGMEKRKEAIVAALLEALHPRGIYERSDLPARAHEGLPQHCGILSGEVPETIEVSQDGVRFAVPLASGHKTGLFLDHRTNRRRVQEQARGRRVLDVFCNSGAFALAALQAGAVEAVGIESAADAIAAARRNAELNGSADRLRLIEANAFDTLRALEQQGERFDLIVLDPPAFTKSARAVAGARRGYKEINLRALRLASPGGVILTASCSYHLGPEEFLEIVRSAAADAGRDVTLLAPIEQAPDHPINLAVPETRYLKGALLLVQE